MASTVYTCRMEGESKHGDKVCPFCGSWRLVKAGKHYDRHGELQRYLCKGCDRMTTKPKRIEVSA